VWPERLPLTARFGVIEFDGRDEETLAEAIQLTRQFRQEGLDLLSVTMGFTTITANIPWAPAFLAPIAAKVRQEAAIPVASSWLLGDPATAERVVAAQQMDVVMVGRPHLANPHWSYQAAQALREEKAAWVLPAPYAHWLERYQGG
jgi:2,4-dienoyl-CoA reductase-like NADH-dependent reductase (Old Yellow Enzyme family)